MPRGVSNFGDGRSVEGCVAPGSGGPCGASGPGVSLPCLNSHNSDSPEENAYLLTNVNSLQGSAKKVAFALMRNVLEFIANHGIDRVGFTTLTFPDHVVDPKESARRINNFNRRVLKLFPWIRIQERMQSGRLHYHLLIAFPDDIRTGADFAAFAKGDYRSAGPALRKLWAWMRRVAKAYGFGRTEILPIRSNAEGVSRYVGKYIAKNLVGRKLCDKGSRRVAYSRGSGPVKPNNFGWNSPGAAVWRAKVGFVAAKGDYRSTADFRRHHGPHWAYDLHKLILSVTLDKYPNAAAKAADCHNSPSFDVAAALAVKRIEYARRSSQIAKSHGSAALIYGRALQPLPAEGQASGALPVPIKAKSSAGQGDGIGSSEGQREAVRPHWADEPPSLKSSFPGGEARHRLPKSNPNPYLPTDGHSGNAL